MRTGLIYVAFALLVWIALRWANHLERYEQLEATGIHTEGKITTTECGNHASFQYRYLAKGRLLAGSGKSSDVSTSCAALSVGQNVAVSYLESSPSISIVGSPDAALLNARLSSLAASLAFPALALFLGHQWRRHKRVALYLPSEPSER